jgi:sec-independent protein translocase protein TatC
MKLLFAFGTIFEMPVIMYFLAKIKVINSRLLTKNRKYTVVLIFVVAALLTPPDVFTQVLMALPLIILYELSIWVVKYVEKQRSKKNEL